MEWLNYHHLLYFWTVARTGSVTKASEELGLAQPTVSSQLRALEKAANARLFRKEGRGLVLTELGQVAFDYADEIFSLGRELQGVLQAQPQSGRPLRLQVGVSDAVPKLVAQEILQPALAMAQPVHLVVREGKLQELALELARHRLDLVLADEALGSHQRIRAFSHSLGDSTVSFFASPELARSLRAGFPRSLDGAPALLPTSNTALRSSVDRWFAGHELRPRVVAEFEDSALVKVFARGGHGFMAAPTVIADEIEARYGLESVGLADGCREKFYAISIERKIKNLAVLEITSKARAALFAP